jgi:hypothetical protein
MESNSNQDAPNVEVLLKQYEQAWRLIEHLDSSYIQISLLYIALIGAYIGVFDRIQGDPILISFCLALIGSSIIGAIWRVRKVVDQQFRIISAIQEEVTAMKKRQEIKGIGKIRTSTYLMVVIVIMTALAIVLTLTK